LYDYHNGASVYAHWAVSDKRALNRDFLSAIFRYPFVQLDCSVLIGLIAGDNESSIAVAEHLGFTLEHTIKDAHPSGELRLYTMRRNECRWLDS
jgi:RimJ/RimL family protein N-acetyltransferase